MVFNDTHQLLILASLKIIVTNLKLINPLK